MVSTKSQWLAVDNENSVGNRCGLPSQNLCTFVDPPASVVDASLGLTLLSGQTQVYLSDGPIVLRLRSRDRR